MTEDPKTKQGAFDLLLNFAKERGIVKKEKGKEEANESGRTSRTTT